MAINTRSQNAAVPSTGRVLGLDLGTRRIGVAVSDSDQRVATAVEVLRRERFGARLGQALAQRVKEWEAAGMVVGVPLGLSGRAGPAAVQALEEIEALRRYLTVPVDTVDERMTTMTAEAALRAAGRRGRRQRAVVDQVAAAVLLQHWLDQRRPPGEADHIE